MNNDNATRLALLKSALENHLSRTTDHVSKTQFACHAVNYAADEMFKTRATSGAWWNRIPVAEAVKADITAYIEGHPNVEHYLEAKGIETDAYEFRKKMLQDLIDRYEAKVLLEEKIAILKRVRALRTEGNNVSHYVCDNVRFEVEATDQAAVDEVCDDIHQHIDGKFSVQRWLSQKNGKHYDNIDEVVKSARIEMIGTLIQRYEDALKEAA